MTVLSPFVYWAQNERNIFLKIDLKDVTNPNISLESNKFNFESKGVGARGLNDYAFSLDFNDEIDTKQSNYKITDNRVVFTLSKVQKAWWPRLIKQTQKPVWLRIDHDRFQSEELDETESPDIHKDYPKLYEKLQKEEFGYKKESFKLVYLTIYNMFMYTGFAYVVCVLCIRYFRDGPDSFPRTYETVGPVMCFTQLLQALEILHPLFGYVKGGVMMPLLQIGGRIFVLFFIIEAEPRLQTMPVVFYLFLTWSTIEVIRYPYYVTRLYKKEHGLLTWFRYSAWMICYPIGFICEGVIIFRNLIFLEQSGKWIYTISSPVELTLKFTTLLRIYMLFIMIPAMYTLMSHMYKVRKQKIGPKKLKKK